MKNLRNCIVKNASLVVPFAFLVLLSCQKKDVNPVDDKNYIEVEFLSSESLEVMNSEFTLSIYGYDLFLMDVPASIISQKSYTATEVPFILKIEIPENTADSIEYNISNKENVRYYIHLDWDSDGNQKICKGDISVDSGFSSGVVLGKVNQNKQTIHLKTILEGTSCE